MTRFFYYILTCIISLNGYCGEKKGLDYIVKLRKGVTPRQALAGVKIKALYAKARRIKGTNNRFLRIKLKEGISHQGITQLKKDPSFEYIEPNYEFKYQASKKITNREIDRGPNNIFQWGISGKFGIGNEYSKESYNGVIIAVLDTGFRLNRVGSLKWNDKEIAGNHIDDDRNGYIDDKIGWDFGDNDRDPYEIQNHHLSHGTPVASIIGATPPKGKNKFSISGVAHGSKVLPIKIYRYSFKEGLKTDVETIISAIRYAVLSGAQIINFSTSWKDQHVRAIKEQIEFANSRGVTFVTTAGNNSLDLDKKIQVYPANYNVDNIIAVGSINSQGLKSAFSGWGIRTVDVFAPGEDIVANMPKGIDFFSGTSFAAPHVTGVIARILSVNPRQWIPSKGSPLNSRIKPSTLKNILIKGSIKKKELSKLSVSNGYINLNRSIREYKIQMKKRYK